MARNAHVDGQIVLPDDRDTVRFLILPDGQIRQWSPDLSPHGDREAFADTMSVLEAMRDAILQHGDS